MRERERKLFSRQINYQQVYHASDVAMYNVQNYIHKLEELKDFDFPFERFKHIEKQQEEETKEEPKVEEIKDEEEIKSPTTQAEEVLKKLSQQPKTVKFDDIEEGDGGMSKQEAGNRQLLRGLKQLNIHFHFMAEPDLNKLHTKSKFRGLFDIGVLSLFSAGYMKS